jgi:serine/threonine-protein kinase ATR
LIDRTLVSEAQLFSEEITTSWLQTARMARKAGHWQTAYSATLQGRQSQNLLAHLESAKLTKAMGEPQRALQELEANLRRHGVVGNDVIDVTMDENDGDRRMRAKVPRPSFRLVQI